MTDKLELEIIRVLMLKNSIVCPVFGRPYEDYNRSISPFDFEIKKGLGIYYKN